MFKKIIKTSIGYLYISTIIAVFLSLLVYGMDDAVGPYLPFIANILYVTVYAIIFYPILFLLWYLFGKPHKIYGVKLVLIILSFFNVFTEMEVVHWYYFGIDGVTLSLILLFISAIVMQLVIMSYSKFRDGKISEEQKKSNL